MPTQIKPQFTRRVGHAEFRSKLTRDDKKGLFVVSGKHNGFEVIGTGETERIAALNFQKQIRDAAKENKITSRG